MSYRLELVAPEIRWHLAESISFDRDEEAAAVAERMLQREKVPFIAVATVGGYRFIGDDGHLLIRVVEEPPRV